MRILCIHGAASNVQIFESQLATFKRELLEQLQSTKPAGKVTIDDTTVDLHYLQGDLETQAYPGIAGLYPGPYYRYWDPDSPLSVRTAISTVHDKMKKDGPFDILLGLSDGAALLVSAVIHALHNVGVRLPRAMLLFMPFPPFAEDCTHRLDIELMPDRRPVIEVPTILVQGDSDIWGGLVGLSTSLFVEQALDIIKWHGGHQVPSLGEREFWATIVQRLLRAYSGKRVNSEI